MKKVVVVTGSSAGIGRATAVEFAKQGARVALLARGQDGLHGALAEVQQAGGEGLIVPTDMADYAQVEAAANEVERTWGPIDVWVNNAMATIVAPFVDIDPADFKRVTEVTYLGVVWGTHVALKRMKARDRGVIVQVGSALEYRSIPLQAPYCGAKSAIRAFTDSLRSELIHDRSNVKLTMVVLPGVNTPQFEWARTTFPRQPKPLGTFYQPEVAARAIVWAAAHPRREFKLGLTTLQSVYANMFVPGLLDRLLASKAYTGQFAQKPLPPGRQDNLYTPVAGDHGAHGPYSDKARTQSVQLHLNKHPSLVALVLGALALGAWCAGSRRRSD